MRTTIQLPPGLHERLVRHLLPAEPDGEEAAFLFARVERFAGHVQLQVIGEHFVVSNEFRVRTLEYLYLDEEILQAVIKRAHDLGCAIVEAHSHPYHRPGAACFSPYDRQGLAEVVPHVMWRLPDRPYVALVVAPEGFDALVWHERGAPPATVDELLDAERSLRPTGYTLRYFANWRSNGTL